MIILNFSVEKNNLFQKTKKSPFDLFGLMEQPWIEKYRPQNVFCASQANLLIPIHSCLKLSAMKSL